MTKKHFKAIAEIIKTRKLASKASEQSIIDSIVYDLANLCYDVNDRFDMKRFLEACGIE